MKSLYIFIHIGDTFYNTILLLVAWEHLLPWVWLSLCTEAFSGGGHVFLVFHLFTFYSRDRQRERLRTSTDTDWASSNTRVPETPAAHTYKWWDIKKKINSKYSHPRRVKKLPEANHVPDWPSVSCFNVYSSRLCGRCIVLDSRTESRHLFK